MEPLKNMYGIEIPKKIAEMLVAVHPEFPKKKFLSSCLTGYVDLELMPRALHISKCLKATLPPTYDRAIKILLRSLGQRPATSSSSLASFLYLPHVFFVRDYGLDHFELSMEAQYKLTKLFTAEFSIRPYLDRYPEKTLSVLKKWAKDKDVHVRRLVSEGTRPRLPWASRLKQFQKDPSPILPLLEMLKDDPELYVRRSVANNLNDIGKDNPAVLIKLCAAWSKKASSSRKWIIQHALRSQIKAGDSQALKLLGFSSLKGIQTKNVYITPTKIKRGAAVTFSVELVNTTTSSQDLLIDYKVHFAKANGRHSVKVFKLKRVLLLPRSSISLTKKISTKPLTTRVYYPGKHTIELLVNGTTLPVGSFELT